VARTKTDRIGSATLTHLLRTDLVPQAYLAPPDVRELREVLRYRVFGSSFPIKEQHHLVRPTQIQLVADHGLEERPAA
jgi:hypothetical protein